MPEKVPHTRVAKRVARKAIASDSATPKKTVRRASTKLAAVSQTNSTKVTRKAPTPLATASQVRRSSRHLQWLGILIFVLSLGAGAVIGNTDAGTVDVNGAIEAYRQTASGREQARLDSIAAGNPSGAPDGGLVPSADQTEPTPPANPEESASSTATSTATSTLATSTAMTSDAAASTTTPTDGTLVPNET